jgi:hypothetical protein
VKLGLLPPIPDRPALSLPEGAAVLTPPPSHIDYFAKTPSLPIWGNDKYGDCVCAAIAHDLEVTSAVLTGRPIMVTTADVLDLYWRVNPDHVDRGCVLQVALEKTLAGGIGGHKPLCFAKFTPSLTGLRAVTADFVSALIAVEIDKAQEYPAKLWDAVKSPYAGGHGVCTGRFSSGPDRMGVATWGYIADMTDSFVASKVGEGWIIVWPWVYNALTSETAAQLAADYQILTGRALPPQAIPPTPGGFDMIPFRLTPTITATLRASAGGPPATSLATVNPDIRVFDLATGAHVAPSQFAYQVEGEAVVGPGQVTPLYAATTPEGLWLVTDSGKPVGLLAHDTVASPTVPALSGATGRLPIGERMVSNIIAVIHNAWKQAPKWFREAIAYGGVALLCLAQSFNWTMPTDINSAELEARLFLTAALVVMVSVLRVKVAPYLAAWFLAWSGYQQVPDGKALAWKA